jgi:pimeloyl-ACP methyl ester carboxylesterase
MLADVRFGRWREALLEPAPPERDPYANGIWHYARGLAFIAEGRLDRARTELAALTRTMGHEAFTTTLKDLPLLTNLKIASRIVEGELAARTDRTGEAIRLVEEAVALEDGIPYSEPPVWHQPPRQVLGAILLEAGRAADAERVYTEDLRRFRENGWSLFGLMQSLSAQGRSAEAAAVRRRFEKAWARADITLTASRIMGRPEAAPPPDTTAAPAPARRSVSLHNEVAIDYVEQGDPKGTPVIFLHGVTDSWKSFEPVLPHLPPSVRALAMTQRGHGESGKPAAGYRFGDLAEDVVHFMDALHIPRAVIVGHSMGAGVAQRFAIDRPERTAGLVLIGSFARLTRNAGIKELYESTISTMTDPVDRSIAAEFQLSTVERPIPAASMEAFIDESLKVPARVWRALFANFLEEDFFAELPRIGTRTLLLWGDRDAFIGQSDQQALTAAIRRSRLVVYEGVGHAVHWEAPARVARDLVAFIEEAGVR